MKSIEIFALVFFALTISVLSSAEESTRDGLYLSAGIGYHYTTLASIVEGETFATQNHRGLLTSVKIGPYLCPSFALYYQQELNWIEAESYIYTSGLNGIGGTLFLKNNTYFEVGLGFGSLTDMDMIEFEKISGLAILTGIGIGAPGISQMGILCIVTVLDDDIIPGVTYQTFSVAFKFEFKL